MGRTVPLAEQGRQSSYAEKGNEVAPRFDPFDPVNEDKHQKLYDHYGKPRDYETPAAPMY